MRTKIEYCNDRDFDYWNIYVTTKNENDFELLLENLDIEELEGWGIDCLLCPTQYENSYTDAFAMSKNDMSKKGFMLIMRKEIKKAKEKIKNNFKI
jgi:hypothetical protein